MAVAGHLHLDLNAGEKAVLADTARRQNLSVPAYIRNRLFEPSSSPADQALIEGLASQRPKFEATLKAINTNLAEIADLRRDSPQWPTFPSAPTDQDELIRISDHLALSA